MKTFSVNGSKGSYVVNLPTNLKEITPEYLAGCVSYVSPAADYSVIAVIYRESLNVILNTFKKKSQANISVVPKFIKTGTTDSDFIKSINCGDTIVVSGSDISLGHHISSPVNKITMENVVNLCDGDKDIWQNSIAQKELCYFVEFKLIPNNAIHAVLNGDSDEAVANSFIHKTSIASA